MKKIAIFLMILVVLALVSFNAQAEELSIKDLLAKAPAINEGIAYSIADSEFKPITTITLFSTGDLDLEAGVTSSKESIRATDMTTAVAQASYTLVSAKDVSIVKDIPIVNLLEVTPGVYAGLDRVAIGRGNSKDNNEFDYGVSLRLASTKW